MGARGLRNMSSVRRKKARLSHKSQEILAYNQSLRIYYNKFISFKLTKVPPPITR